jgi:hypothetical protein
MRQGESKIGAGEADSCWGILSPMKARTWGLAPFLSVFSAIALQSPAQTKPIPTPPPLPFTTQIRKAVVLIQTNCLAESNGPSPQSAPTKTVVTHFGTGFLVGVRDPASPDRIFEYLVTNHHVAQPGIEDGKPCNVLSAMAKVNPKDASRPAVNMGLPFQNWQYPSDPGIDLAAMPILLNPADWDTEVIPLSIFAIREGASAASIVEGDPVMYAGLFVQFAGISRFEPIVRAGRVAMVPGEKIPATLKLPANIYLTEAHAFGGNSGSPMFVNLGGLRGNVFGIDSFKFLGVVAGEVHENADFTLSVSTTLTGQAAANSGISVVVPADDVKALLMSPVFVQQRQRSGQFGPPQ